MSLLVTDMIVCVILERLTYTGYIFRKLLFPADNRNVLLTFISIQNEDTVLWNVFCFASLRHSSYYTKKIAGYKSFAQKSWVKSKCCKALEGDKYFFTTLKSNICFTNNRTASAPVVAHCDGRLYSQVKRDLFAAACTLLTPSLLSPTGWEKSLSLHDKCWRKWDNLFQFLVILSLTRFLNCFTLFFLILVAPATAVL